MRPPEAEERGRVQVRFRVGVAVMVAVVRGPPQHALLRGGGGHDGDDELKRAAGLKGAMGKVAMVPGRDKKHPHVKQRQADNQVRPAKTQKKHGHTCQVNGKKRKRADQGDPCAIAEGNRCGCHTEVSFECGPGMPTAVSASVEEGPAAAAPGKTSLTIGARGEGVKPRLKACCPSGAWQHAISLLEWRLFLRYAKWRDRKSTRLNSSHSQTSNAVSCLK